MAKSEKHNANMPMPFGQYRGVKLVELPKSYLHWLAFKADVAGQLQRSAVAALEYRSALELKTVTARSPMHHGPYRGTPMIDVPASELHYWIHHHRSTHADVAGASLALMEQTGAKLRETFGSTLAERVGGFPEPPDGWQESAGSSLGSSAKVSPPAFPRLSHARE